jgi:tetratricopeptide (TPR) repeat protein
MGQTRSEEDLREEFESFRRHIEVILAQKVETIFFTGLSSELVGRLVSKGSQLPQLDLNLKHSFLREFRKYYLKNASITRELVSLLYDIAQIQSDGNELLRSDDVCKRCESLILRLNGGDQADLTRLLPSPITETTVQRADLGDVTKRRKSVDLLSCGNVVRVVRPDLARRATLSFVEDGAGTVEVMYLKREGGEEEEDSVPAKTLRKLLDFEEVSTSADEFAAFRENLFKAASAAKEEGNQLFKLKDYDAAIERYSTIICGFASRPRTQGSVVLVRSGNRLKTVTVTSVDRDDGTCSLSDGSEISPGAALPVLSELLPLHTAAYMNRARCRQNLGLHLEAVQDLSLVLGLWTAADPRMLQADPEMLEASAKGCYTAQYLRARSAMACGYVKLAATDVKEALAQNPPAATVKQLRQLKGEVQVVQEEHRRVNGPLSKELARLKIALGQGPELS